MQVPADLLRFLVAPDRPEERALQVVLVFCLL
jgi:hypothetical protein